jgi:flagellar biosynthesis anti-sigma factor FlgM
MKITGQNPYAKVEATRSDPKRGVKEDSSLRSSATGQAATEVKLSGTAQALQEARSPETPDLDRIAELRAQVERGELEIDPQRIADAMLRDER